MMGVLIERWMDTTHSFHLPFEEMTTTLLDFITITRLIFFKEPVPFSNEVYSFVVVRNKWLKDLLDLLLP